MAEENLNQPRPLGGQVSPSGQAGLTIFQKDLIISAAVGLLCALLILPIAQNFAIKQSWALSLLVVLPILSVLGMWLTYLIATKIKVVYQLAKFVLVGALNTFVDWGILNLLIFLTSIASGYLYMVFKGASFLIATVNSYYWNKFWTFKKLSLEGGASEEKTGKEMLQFFVVSVIGFLLNVGIATLIVNVWGPQWGIGAVRWANVGAFAGTLAGMTWNFLGYKLIVFKS